MAEFILTPEYIEFIKTHEAYGPGRGLGRDGTDHVAYQDNGGKWTIGYGHTAGVKDGDRWTDEEALAMIPKDVADHVETTRKHVPGFDKLNPNQQAGVVDVFYNTKLASILKSDALKNLNNGDWEGWQREANGDDGFNKWDNPATGLRETDPGRRKRGRDRAALGDTPVEAPTQTAAPEPVPTNALSAETPTVPEAAPTDSLKALTAPQEAPDARSAPAPTEPTPAPEIQPTPVQTQGEFAPAQGTDITPPPIQDLPATIRERNTGKEPGYRESDFSPAKGTTFYMPPKAAEAGTIRQRNEIEMTRKEKYDADSQNGFGALMIGSFQNENGLVHLASSLDGKVWGYDEKMDIEAELKVRKGIVQDLVSGGGQEEEVGRILGGAQNVEHLDWLIGDLQKKKEWEMRISEAGMKGMAAMLPAVIVDFDALIGFGVGKAVKLKRLGTVLKSAAYAGTTGAAIEGYLAVNNPYRDMRNVGFAAAGGIVLGGAFGALAHKSNARWLELADDMARSELDRDLAHLMARYNAGERSFDPKQWEMIQLADSKEFAKNAGAAERVLGKSEDGKDFDIIPGARKTVSELDPIETAPEFRWQWMQKLQVNIQGKLFGSLSQTMKNYSAKIIEGGLIVDKKATRAFTAEGRSHNLEQTWGTRMFREADPHFKAWAEANDYGTIAREVGIEANEKFYNEVGAAIRGIDDLGGKPVSKEAKAVAANIDKQMKEVHAMARDVGLPGFVDAEPLNNFMPRSWNRLEMTKIFEKVEDSTLAQWFTEAMARNMEDVDDAMRATLKNVGEGFVTAIRRQHAGMEDMLMHGIPFDDLDRLSDLFRGLDIDSGVVDELTRRLGNQADNVQKGGVKHGKQRLRIDETFDALIQPRPGMGDPFRLTIDMMTNSDAGKVVPRYFKVMAGWIGLAKEAGIKSDSDVDALVRVMQTEGASTSEIKAFQESIRLITGRSVEENVSGLGSQASRISLGYNYTTRGGSFGIAQLPEMGVIASEVGFRTFLKNIPELRSMMKRMANGEIENELSRELEDIVAAGTDWINGQARSNFGDMGEEFTHESLKKVDGLLQRGGRLTQALSLMGPINTALERMAVYDIAQDWANLARKGSKSISEAKKARLRAAGLTYRMQDRIFKQINEHATFDGKKMTNLNIKDWKDLGAVDHYTLGIDRQRRFVIQRNDIGNMGSYAHKPLGRMLTQFQSFMLNSINKQLLRNVHHNDIQTWVGFATTTFFGGLAYTFQTNVDYAFDPKERERRLEPLMVATAAFQRAGWSSIIPPLIDTTLSTIGGRDPLFSHSRTSGLGSSIITGNSTLTTAQDAIATAGLPFRMLLNSDYHLSEQDTKRMRRLVPGQRLLGISNAFHAIDEILDLPKTSKSK